MRTLIVTHYFPPEVGAPQARLSELARHWAAAGDEVTVLTGMPNHPTGVIPPEYRGKHRLLERVDGYDVVRTWLYATPNEGVVKKTLGHLSFMVSSVVLGYRKIGRPDTIVVSSPTFFSILSGWLFSKFKRARFVVEVRDLWPALFVELGVVTNRRVIRALEVLELAAYRAADRVVVVTEGFRDDLIRRGVPPDKVHTIHNGVDLERFSNKDISSAPPSRFGAADDEAVVLYIGAHGLSQGLPAVLDAAHLLRGEPLHFAFIGHGAMKDELMAQARDLDLPNVTFHDPVPRDDVPALLTGADICLVTLRNIPLFAKFIPSKMFEYLAMGTAVLGAVDGEAARILHAADATVVPPEDGPAMAKALRALVDTPDERQRKADAGQSFVQANFDRRHLANRYRDLLAEVAASDARSRRSRKAA